MTSQSAIHLHVYIYICIIYILPIVPSSLTNLYLQIISFYQLPCGRKPENTEKTHDIQQSVVQLLPRMINVRTQDSNS